MTHLEPMGTLENNIFDASGPLVNWIERPYTFRECEMSKTDVKPCERCESNKSSMWQLCLFRRVN